MVKRDKPLVLEVSPACMFFSITNQGPIAPKELAEAKELMRFAVEMCDLQLRADRHFVFEQPLTSRAWALEPVVKLMSIKDVIATEFHQSDS